MRQPVPAAPAQPASLPALPLEEEGPRLSIPAQDAECVGVDRVEPVPVPEVPRGPVRRVNLDYLPSQGAGLLGQGRAGICWACACTRIGSFGAHWRGAGDHRPGRNAATRRSCGTQGALRPGKNAGNGRLAHRGGRRRRCRDAGVSDKRHPPRRAAAVATWSFERVGRRGSPESRGESGRRGH